MSSPGEFPWTEAELANRLTTAVKAYWGKRTDQSNSQIEKGVRDVGTRGEVTGGLHLNGFLDLLVKTAQMAGFSNDEIKLNSRVELPGFFRPQKRWDLIVVREQRLCAALELKSLVGSFGKNFNNRSEEALGSSTDFWTAFREGRLGKEPPWLGYFVVLELSPDSTRPVALKPSLFPP